MEKKLLDFTLKVYSPDGLIAAISSEGNVVEDILQQAHLLENPALVYQREESAEHLRSLFVRNHYREAYWAGKKLSASFHMDPDCPQFLRWETDLLFAKACIYFVPWSNEGPQEITRVNQEMESEILQNPLFKWSDDKRKQWFSLKGTAFHLLGYDFWMNKGNLDEAIKKSQLALGCYEKAGMLEEAATMHDNIGRVLSLNGDQDGASKEIAKGLEIRSLLGQPYRMALSYISCADTCLRFGGIDQARQYLEQARQICDNENNLRGIGLVSILYGHLYRLMGNQVIYTSGERLSFLKMAVSYLERAKAVFHDQVIEPIREKDAMDELGQIYQYFEKVRMVSSQTL